MKEEQNYTKYNKSLITESTYSKDVQDNNSLSNNINKELIKKNSLVEFKEKESSFKPAKSKEDNFFKKKILGEEWFQHSKYLDIDLVQDHLSSFKYLWLECQNLETICTEQLFNHAMNKPDLYDSQNVRTIVRNGIPPKYMRKFILRLFNISKNEESLKNNYKKILDLVLKGYKTENLKNYVPYFTGFKK